MADPWASDADVTEITGATVTPAQLAQAQTAIETVTGRTAEATARIGPRDLRWLKRAVAYQAVWMADQPDLFTRSTTTGPTIQDGAHVNLTADGQILAPLARRALKRLSWRGNRSVFTQSTLAAGGGGIRYDAEGVVAVHDYSWDRWRRWSQ